MACFLSTILYNNGSSYHETSDGFIMTFGGHLKFGALRFENLHIKLRMENRRCPNTDTRRQSGIVAQLIGNYQEGTQPKKLGIFHIPTDSEVNLNIGQDSRVASRGSFLGLVNVLGFKNTVNVNISQDGLKFRTKGKIHDMFDVSAIFNSRLVSWNDQRFTATGVFEGETVDGSLHRALENELTRYSTEILAKVKARLELSTETEKRAKYRLREVQILRDEWFKKFQEVKKEHGEAEYQLNSAEYNLDTLLELAEEFSDEIRLLKDELNKLCKVKHCPKICKEGRSCYNCWNYVISRKMGKCPATCNNAKQVRIDPRTMDTICINQNCKRIHTVHSWLGDLSGLVVGLGGTFAGLPPQVAFRTGKSVSKSFRGRRSVNKADPDFGAFPHGVTGNLSAVEALKEVLDNSKVFSSVAKGNRNLGSMMLDLLADHLPREVLEAYKTVKNGEDELISPARRFFEKVPVVGDFLQLVQKSEGRWHCEVEAEKCTKERFEYNYTHTPYTCELPCEQRYINKSIPGSCCPFVSCASFIANKTCISENTFCKKARRDALQQILKVKANAAKILASLDSAQRNVSFWERKMRRLYIKKRSASRSFQAYKTATRSLEEAYNVTVQNRKTKLKILARPFMLRNFFNKLGESLVKVEDIKFKAKVSAKHNLTLLPINMTVSLNGTRHEELSAILDFTNFNRSLRSITKDILNLYIGDVSRLSRKKRSIKNTNGSTEDSKFYTLQTFHRLCSEFSNHKQTLFEVFASLYNLSSEIQQFRENDTQKLTPSIANSSAIFERVSINQTKAKELGVEISYDSYSNVLENDPELLEAIGFQDDVLGETIEAVESSSKLLYKNWLATMENIFESISEECSGFDDCLKYTIDSLAEITFDASLINAEKLRAQIGNVETKVFNLTRQSDMSVSDALYISQDILQILENMTGLENVCAQAPNITEQPAPFTNLGVNDTLVLRCNATGDSLTYQWRFNGDILENQSTNILRLKKTSPLHSGNYSCEVSNHVAKATSILALVVISTRPVIVHHPAQRRNFILSEDDSLHCQVQKNARNITFQWWFKPFKSSFFTALPNETFSRLSFAPVKSHHEGWYFCNVSNRFSHTISKTSFVRVLKYTLPVPAAKLTLTVISKSRSSNKLVYYHDSLAKVLASRLPNTNNNSQRVEERIRELHPTGCRIITRHDGFDHTEICDWTFSAVGENVTSNAILTSATSQQMPRLISATFKIKKALGKLGNETNAGMITFRVNKTNYSVQKHSLGIVAMSLLCPKRQFLVENVYKCGKFFTH